MNRIEREESSLTVEDVHGDAHVRTGSLVDEIEREMNAAWAEAHEADEHRAAEDELIARHAIIASARSEALVSSIAYADERADGMDETIAVAAIVLERRMAAEASLVPLLKASLAYEQAKVELAAAGR